MKFKVYIPARYAASRLPGKPLAEVAGKPLLQHVYERAIASSADEVVIATDDERIAEAAQSFGARSVLTDSTLRSGTDRIAAAAAQLAEPADTTIVNLQGDEPEMSPRVIRQVAAALHDHDCAMASVCEPVEAVAAADPNIVKVVRDGQDYALYFSRALIPHTRDANSTMPLRRHVGLYAYRVEFLRQFVALPAAPLEKTEALEQLRALAHGFRIVVPDAIEACGEGIDTPEDLARLRERMAAA